MISTETQTEPVDTRESLLDAAEGLFAEHGIQASSLRMITQRAGANLAAVHYHFGSKEGLVRAVFSRRIKPLNEERLRLLDACDLEAEDAVEQVLSAYLAPLLRRRAREGDGQTCSFARLMGRAFAEPSGEVQAVIMEEFGEMIRRFTVALACILPDLTETEVLWRFHFVAGAMAHTVGCGNLLEQYSKGLCQAADPDEALGHLIPFLSAGLRAPATS